MSEEVKKYRIDLDEEQLELISKCLDMTSRMYCGQLDTNTLFPLRDIIIKNPEPTPYLLYVDKPLTDLKKSLFPGLGEAHYGIGHNEKSDRLYDMYKQIQHTIQKEKDLIKGKRSTNVHSYPPRQHTGHSQIEVTHLTIDKLRDESLDELID